jgi:hypothetical protein
MKKRERTDMKIVVTPENEFFVTFSFVFFSIFKIFHLLVSPVLLPK